MTNIAEACGRLLTDFLSDVGDDFNFAFDIIDKTARTEPDRLAMIHIEPSGKRVDYSWGYFARESSKLANALCAQGMKKGDRVMLILHRRVEFWVAMLALHKIGAVAVPSPDLTAKDIAFRVNYGKLTCAIIEDVVAARAEEVRGECPTLKLLVKVGEGTAPSAAWLDWRGMIDQASADFPRLKDAPCGNDPLVVFFTSGTTGMPKMVEHNHFYPLGHIATGLFWHHLSPGGIHLTLSDTGWGKALWGKFYGQWMAGAVVFVWDFRTNLDPSALLDLMAQHKVSSFCAPPTVYRVLVRKDLTKHDFSHLKHCNTAGELLNDSVFEKWKAATGLPIYEGYGQTETTLLVATFPWMTPKPGSIGKPVSAWDVVLLNDQGQVSPIGEEGEICIRLGAKKPIGLFTEYMDEPEKTAQVVRDGYYHTGDKAYRDEDGYFWFIGRVDDLIKTAGYRVGPFEVESELITHKAIVEAAVTAIPDALRGQAIKATVILAEGFTPSDDLAHEIIEYMRSRNPHYKCPKVVVFAKELPKTISGKIRRSEIRRLDAEKQAEE